MAKKSTGITSNSQTGNKKFTGYVMDYNDKFHFGERIEGPHPVYFTVWAPTADAAKVALTAKAFSKGYALGGVQGIRQV